MLAIVAGDSDCNKRPRLKAGRVYEREVFRMCQTVHLHQDRLAAADHALEVARMKLRPLRTQARGTLLDKRAVELRHAGGRVPGRGL